MRTIKSLPFSLRPREKLLKYGAEILSIEELVSVILVTGTKSVAVSTQSKKVSKIIKNKNITYAELSHLGLGPSKAAQILAAVELGKRLVEGKTVKITQAEQIYALSYEILHSHKESLLCFYLNARGELVKKELLAVGSLNKANLVPREIFSVIKDLPVAGIILVHNHPSGDLQASKEDILFTRRVKLACDILGVKLLDHLIVGDNGWSKISVS